MLVSEDLEIKIADFGFAVRVEGQYGGGARTTSLGTPGYMAPEIMEGRAYSGAAVDLYALGVILFVMVTVNMPFSSLSCGQIPKGRSVHEFDARYLRFNVDK